MFLSVTTVSEVPGVALKVVEPFSPLAGSTEPSDHE